VTKVPGSNAVGQSLRDGTAGGVTAVVTAAVRIPTVDDMVCAAKELTGTPAASGLASDCESVSTSTSTESTLLVGADVSGASAWVDFLDSDFLVAVGSAAGGESSAAVGSALSVELVWAPPVLTTTPGGACAVVDPVEVDVGLGSDVGSAVLVGLSAGSAESDAGVADVDESVDVDSDDDDSDDGVSAHATPYPVTTAAPTPRATAKPPTRPTYEAALMPFAIRAAPHQRCDFRESAVIRCP
jgi:hypothetical protein